MFVVYFHDVTVLKLNESYIFLMLTKTCFLCYSMRKEYIIKLLGNRKISMIYWSVFASYFRICYAKNPFVIFPSNIMISKLHKTNMNELLNIWNFECDFRIFYSPKFFNIYFKFISIKRKMLLYFYIFFSSKSV